MTCSCGYEFPPIFLVMGEIIPTHKECPICQKENEVGEVKYIDDSDAQGDADAKQFEEDNH